MNRFKVTDLGSLGYGNPDAKIGFGQIVERNNIPLEVVKYGREILKSGECMVKVNRTDDGCMDGRLTEEVLLPFVTENGVEFRIVSVDVIKDPVGNIRYKLAGGGYLTSLAMKLALDPDVKILHDDLGEVINQLTKHGVYCGLHTANCNGNETGCGCGASDALKEILLRGREYKDEVNGTIETILSKLGAEYSPDAANRADEGLLTTLGHKEYFDSSNGKARFELIMKKISEIHLDKNIDNTKPLSVCKGLKGGHKEIFTVINTVEDTTFSQAEFTKRIKEQFPDLPDSQIPEVFAIDVPRIQELAEVMAKDRENEAEAYQAALYAGLSFQFATAAELTDGTLENYLVQAA